MPIACENIHATIGEFQRDYIYKIFIETVPLSVATAFPLAYGFSSRADVYNDSAVFSDRKTDNINIKWCGEFFDIPGVDASTRNFEFSFYDDEPMWVYDFFNACKDLTGNEYNQAGVWGIHGKFNIGVAKVSVDKETITAYRRLVGCRVYGVDASTVNKSNNSVSKIKVSVRWDRNQEDKLKRGMKV